MQTANNILTAVGKIAKCGFETGYYIYTKDGGKNYSVICFASDGPHRRYFSIGKADTEKPLIYPVVRTESKKEIQDVNLGPFEWPIALQDLIKGGHDSVLRGLGLYRALYERRKLKLEDFSLPNLWIGVLSAQSVNGFIVQVCDIETLKVDTRFPYRGSRKEKAAHEAAKSFNEEDSFAFVTNEYGFTVAVYHQGERVV
jgi:hypothetical protein